MTTRSILNLQLKEDVARGLDELDVIVLQIEVPDLMRATSHQSVHP